MERERMSEERCPTCGSDAAGAPSRIGRGFDSPCINKFHDAPPQPAPLISDEELDTIHVGLPDTQDPKVFRYYRDHAIIALVRQRIEREPPVQPPTGDKFPKVRTLLEGMLNFAVPADIPAVLLAVAEEVERAKRNGPEPPYPYFWRTEIQRAKEKWHRIMGELRRQAAKSSDWKQKFKSTRGTVPVMARRIAELERKVEETRAAGVAEGRREMAREALAHYDAQTALVIGNTDMRSWLEARASECE